MPGPTVAVVVASHNRARLLPRLVAALEAQTHPPVELAIVDDASTDDTWTELERLADRSTLTIKVFRLPQNRGAATARNVGWRAVTADIVAFTDDDCAPQPDWIAALLTRFDGADIVQGRTVPDPSQFAAHGGPFSHVLGIDAETGYYETCNIAYRRAVLDAVAGFDESFRYPYGEDTDLAWRAKESGYASAFAPDAVVYHDVIPRSLGAHLADMRRREGLVHALRRHPGLRGRLGLGYFFRRSHPPALAAVPAGGAFLLRRDAASALACAAVGAWYVRECRWSTAKPARRAQWLGVVPQRLIADLYEIFILLRASIRYRTVLL